jgi:hypothetical protein
MAKPANPIVVANVKGIANYASPPIKNLRIADFRLEATARCQKA